MAYLLVPSVHYDNLKTLFSARPAYTHTITGSIVGVGAAQKFSAVRRGLAGRIVWARVLTIPGAAFIAWGLGQ